MQVYAAWHEKPAVKFCSQDPGKVAGGGQGGLPGCYGNNKHVKVNLWPSSSLGGKQTTTGHKSLMTSDKLQACGTAGREWVEWSTAICYSPYLHCLHIGVMISPPPFKVWNKTSLGIR